MYDSILLLLHCGAYLDPEDKAHFFVIGPWMDGWWLHIHTRTYMAEVHHYFTMTEYRKWLNVFALLLTLLTMRLIDPLLWSFLCFVFVGEMASPRLPLLLLLLPDKHLQSLVAVPCHSQQQV